MPQKFSYIADIRCKVASTAGYDCRGAIGVYAPNVILFLKRGVYVHESKKRRTNIIKANIPKKTRRVLRARTMGYGLCVCVSIYVREQEYVKRIGMSCSGHKPTRKCNMWFQVVLLVKLSVGMWW